MNSLDDFFTVTRLRKWFGTGFTASITIGLMVFGGLALLGVVGILLSGLGPARMRRRAGCYAQRSLHCATVHRGFFPRTQAALHHGLRHRLV